MRQIQQGWRKKSGSQDGLEPKPSVVRDPADLKAFANQPPKKAMGAGGGGGASGKMLYRPRVSQSRIGVLRAMLNLPRLK